MATVFLLCSELSGSNLITRMVDNHPQYCTPSPAHLIRLLAPYEAAYGDLTRDDPWRRLCADTADILATTLSPWRTTPTAAELQARVPDRTLPALLRHVFADEVAAHGKSELFVAESRLWRDLPYLLTVWPDARAIVLVRDPRDVALAWKRSPVHRGDVVRAARVWQQDQAAGLSVVGHLRDGRHGLLLTYEDLAIVPELEMIRLCRFLGVAYDPAQLRGPDAGDTVGEFRAGLSPSEVALVERICAQEMEQLDYVPETADRRSLTELEARLLPRERHDKPEYRLLPAKERAARARRELLIRRLEASREPASLSIGS